MNNVFDVFERGEIRFFNFDEDDKDDVKEDKEGYLKSAVEIQSENDESVEDFTEEKENSIVFRS